jgi:hypothetical protein
MRARQYASASPSGTGSDHGRSDASAGSTIAQVVLAVTVCIAGGLSLAAVSRPLAAWLCRLSPRVDESWIPVMRYLLALAGASLASIGAVLLLGSVR